SMATTTAILPAFHVYAVITSTPLIYKFLSHSELNYNIFGVTILLFLTFLILFAKFNAKTLRESIALRFENLKLIEELKVQKKEAEQANTAKTKFLAAASHDLRQPLHAMGLLLGVLEQAPQATELQPVIQKIKRSCGAMSTLLETLLDISKLDAGIVKNSPSYFSLDNLFSSLKSEFEVLADEQGISLKIIPSSVTTYADYAHLERVIRNLVSNAIRYTPNGRVTLGAKRHHGSVLICVYDTGPGIPESKQKIVFNEFQQLENPERDRSKGLGLGLAIVKRLTGIMGTPLHVVSIEGKGSCFSVELPLCNQNEHMQEASLPQTSNNVLVGKRILIVDDEADILDAFESLLTSWGAQVLCATSGAEAEERVKGKDFQPHLIVSDYRLRNNETGSDVIRRIQKIVPQAVAIIVTGDTDPARLKEAEETGFYLLHKPVSTAKLRTLVTFSLMDT
ncbi:MAG: hybrid sensor histidine kinase/response regulator, partial [Gammaproteobacteria bacterium]|nr:hybrid sensor histidine kinase/response regulator [Gammaproteobacteria bacterium]